MRTKNLLLAISTIVLVAVGGCGGSTAGTLSSPSATQAETLVMSPSWAAEKVLDMNELGRNATRVVSGVVESVGPSQPATLAEGPEAGVAVVYADAIIRVDRALKGEAAGKAERVAVRLLGGTVDGYTFVYEDEAELREGDRVILFLTDDPGPLYPHDGGFQYAVLWGMHGAFRIEGDVGVRSDRIPADKRDVPLTEIEESVR
jgi:hypothetical protein